MVVVKRYGVDFTCAQGCTALTLSQEDVMTILSPKPTLIDDKCYFLVHNSGWTISAIPKKDYFVWINDFVATHPTIGYVHGDFEHEVIASSEEAFNDFYTNHPPRSWDYGDI